MPQLVPSLDERTLRALADLEGRTLAADGGRLKLEWGELTGRTEPVSAVVEWEGDVLRGFLGLYAFGPPDVELAGAVDPASRRRGLGTALLEVALPVCRERGYGRALLVAPRSTPTGREFALARGGVLDRSEHALDLVGDPLGDETGAAVALRPAVVADLPVVRRLLAAAFGAEPGDLAARFVAPGRETVLVEVAGEVVGTARLTRDGGSTPGTTVGGVYGFAVDPARQGQGIGRAALRVMCRRLRAQGCAVVHLEVEVDNERALGLYTSTGFALTQTEDYFALPL